MTPDLYNGEPDERQSTEPDMVPTRFRPRYRQLTDYEKALHDEIKNVADQLVALYEEIPAGGRYKALAITALEESVMWAVKELTK